MPKHNSVGDFNQISNQGCYLIVVWFPYVVLF